MALVAYSDSEGSDAEPDTTPALPTEKTKKPDTSGFQVDRSNPRKIRVALPEIKPETPAGQAGDDGPARKKPRLGGGGGLSGFNSFLPAPKRTAEKKSPVASTRKPFSLKTGAGPGFDRTADAETRNEQAFNDPAADADAEAIPAAGSLNTTTPDTPEAMKKPGEVKLQGNPMMFRPLSVGRPKKKKSTKAAPQPTPGPAAPKAAPQESAPQPPAPAAPKPKVSLFSLSSEESRADTIPGSSATYEPLVYNAEGDAPPAGPAVPESTYIPQDYPEPVSSSNISSLDTVANDLNLSKAERRQLFGRNAIPSQSQVRTFNTDEEYASNQVLAQGELAAAQHNPVRAIAPGKHSLQQLVNAASSQKDALEESFAAGRRNKKEAGSKYGW
ncbi:hypothetical protein PENANT_c026G05799 [Penicillium antarcticum]|uniref:Mitotic checkpoint regulator, MAD2B-interacting-domain-containing protein n=1 Tax=Penicillium antarcticum TaxID=416450 RepID=A0A1V6PYP6_9EURO|nr:uncharacterized protein N7508_000134 [Penicillium antarcticum]KAJ5319851.1 hypothetical protein N7508_000134 [Penicillium antarcticum]OQD81606.1 hypothetical protein PENANT_c026G05799 [Penicillium antarcticum]